MIGLERNAASERASRAGTRRGIPSGHAGRALSSFAVFGDQPVDAVFGYRAFIRFLSAGFLLFASCTEDLFGVSVGLRFRWRFAAVIVRSVETCFMGIRK